MSPEVTKRKLVFLTQYLKDLSKYKKISDVEFEKNHYEIERLLQLIIEVACDINSHLITRRLQRPPEDYYESFIELGNLNIIPKTLALKLAPSAGLRNALVHAYDKIDEKRVKQGIQLALRYFPKYVKALGKIYAI